MSELWCGRNAIHLYLCYRLRVSNIWGVIGNVRGVEARIDGDDGNMEIK